MEKEKCKFCGTDKDVIYDEHDKIFVCKKCAKEKLGY